MRVSVEIITGTYMNTEVSENATVKELKEEIAKEVQLSVRPLILMVGDGEERRMVMEDEDETMLIDLGVREDSHMYLFFKHPDLVCKEETSQGKGEEEARTITEGEDEDTAMKNGEGDRDVDVDDREKKKKNLEETKDDDDGNEKAREGDEGENEMDTVS